MPASLHRKLHLIFISHYHILILALIDYFDREFIFAGVNMLKLIVSFLLILISNQDEYSEKLKNMISWFPEGSYQEINFYDFSYIDELNKFCGKTFLYLSPEKIVNKIPGEFAKASSACLVVQRSHKTEFGSIISLPNPQETILKALKAKQISPADDRFRGKRVYQGAINATWEKVDVLFIAWDSQTILGSTSFEFLEQMTETREAGLPTILDAPYYQEFVNIMPQLGGYVHASFNDENLLALFEEDYKNGTFPKERLEFMKTHLPLSPTYLISILKIEDNKYVEESIIHYKTEDAAEKVMDKEKFNPKRPSFLEGKVIKTRVTYSPEEIQAKEKLIRKYEAYENLKKAKAKEEGK